MFAKVISIGATCQTARQIRNLLEQREAYYFDWLISPLPAVMKSIENGFTGILQPENLSYSDHRKIRLIDSINGLQYQHDFPVDEKNDDPALREMILPDFVDHAHLAREKYIRRALRTLDVLSSGVHILLVRYVQDASELAPQRRNELKKVFAHRFPSGQLSFLWASPHVEGFNTVDDGWLCNLPPSPRWDGDAEGWRRALTFCGAISAQTA